MKKHFIMIVLWGLSAVLLFYSHAISEQRSIRLKEKSPESRLALVIGNADYEDAPLKNSVNDARDIADTLKQVGFEVIYKENAGKKVMEESVREFGKQLSGGGVGLFYFSGHGLQLNGQNYLIPVDARIESASDIEFDAVDADRVIGKMQDAKNSLNIVILDACRNNPFEHGARNRGVGTRGLAKMNAPAGSIIAYATAPDSTASDGTGRNGVYTRYLMKYMKIPGLTIERVLKNTRIDVANETGNTQIPWEHSSLMTDFYFADSSGAVIVQPVPERESSLIVRPNVSDAAVWINDKKMGTGTLSFRQIQPGSYRIKVEKEGYLPYQISVEVERGAAKELPVFLAKPEPKRPPVPAKIINSVGMEFVYISPGTFTMGSRETMPGRKLDEKQHRVTLSKGFYMQTTEVTQGQWKSLMGDNPSYFIRSCGDKCPVENVSWDDVQVFIAKLNQKDRRKYRLPTEAEWEYACRAGTNTPFAFGECLSANQANYNGVYPLKGCPDGAYREKTVPAASFKSNDWGLYDMHGNVWEWCQDWYGDYPSSAVTDPAGPSSGTNRIFRGGSWYDVALDCRSAKRHRISPGYRFNLLGFRLVLSPDQQ